MYFVALLITLNKYELYQPIKSFHRFKAYIKPELEDRLYQFTVEPKNKRYLRTMGQASEFAFHDALVMNTAYCEQPMGIPELDCQNGGYQGRASPLAQNIIMTSCLPKFNSQEVSMKSWLVQVWTVKKTRKHNERKISIMDTKVATFTVFFV